VLADVRCYADWYGVNGFLFDRAHVDCATVLGHYRPLREATHELVPGATIILNPGTGVPECYLEAADILLDFEGSRDAYMKTHPPAWRNGYDAGRFWQIVYDVAPADVDRVVARARRLNTGWLTVTDQALATPAPGYLYDRLPSGEVIDALRHVLRGY
jgi:hypothetical protein